MPLKPLPYKEVRARLMRAGFSPVAQSGSHVKFAKNVQGGTMTTIVPMHSEIAIGTLRSIIRQAGFSIDEWDNI